MTFGPRVAFGSTALVQILAAAPLLGIPKIEVARDVPGALKASVPGILLFITDGWIAVGFMIVWQIGLFITLGESFLAYGGALPEGWGSGARKVDFYDVKGDIEALLTPADLRFEKLANPALHPGRAARILVAGREIGCIGELHPEWVQKYDLPQAPVVFELDFEALKAVVVPAYAEVSKFPPVIRDLAIVVDQHVELRTLIDGLKGQVSGLVQDIQLFDVYVGKGVPENKKSLAFRIVMQDTQRTLQDSEVDAAMQQLVSCFEQAFGAQLRA